MKDYLVRAMTTNKEVRALTIRSTDLVEDARQSHNTSPVATAALGRALSAGAMMGSMLKSGDEIALSFQGNGPLEKIVVEANQYGEVRGYVNNPNVELIINDAGKLDVAGAIGTGILTVRKRIGVKEPYEGTVHLVSGEIGDDLTYYFTQSEQTPSAVGVGVLVDTDLSVKAAGGFIIQLMPGASEETVNLLENNLQDVQSVSRLIEAGLTPEEFLEKILSGFDYRILNTKDIRFECKCNRERVRDLMVRLGEKELEETLAEQGKVEIKCHYCGSIYSFDQSEVEEALKSAHDSE